MQPDTRAKQRSWPGSSRKETDRVLAAHRAAGRPFTAGGVRSFVREAGAGPAVVFVHGMWGASFAYRKLLADIADRGMRGIAWDLPGFGFADRPRRRDYSWAALGRFSADAVDALHLDRFHLVVHDVGGPVGFELAAARPDQVLSLTILNTMVDVAEFRPPWSMRPFRTPVLGELWKAGLNRTLFRGLMRLQGIGDTTQISNAELDAYLRRPGRTRPYPRQALPSGGPGRRHRPPYRRHRRHREPRPPRAKRVRAHVMTGPFTALAGNADDQVLRRARRPTQRKPSVTGSTVLSRSITT